MKSEWNDNYICLTKAVCKIFPTKWPGAIDLVVVCKWKTRQTFRHVFYI